MIENNCGRGTVCYQIPNVKRGSMEATSCIVQGASRLHGGGAKTLSMEGYKYNLQCEVRLPHAANYVRNRYYRLPVDSRRQA